MSTRTECPDASIFAPNDRRRDACKADVGCVERWLVDLRDCRERRVTRLTPSGDWTFAPSKRARFVIPQPDGTLLVLTERGGDLGVIRVRPPDSGVTDSASLPDAPRILHAQVGDRVYFGVDSSLIALRGRSLQVGTPLQLSHRIQAVAPTPSGDRLFLAMDSSRTLAVVDRYRDQVERSIELPGAASALRMDPLGRYVLARSAKGDSAWVVAVGTARVIDPCQPSGATICHSLRLTALCCSPRVMMSGSRMARRFARARRCVAGRATSGT
jgi:hypothetical protein